MIDNLCEVQFACIEWVNGNYYFNLSPPHAARSRGEISEKFDDDIPLDFDQLTSIKGIGPYTANAILAIGANQSALAVDAKLERVLSRIYGIVAFKGPKLQGEIQRLFEDKKICSDMSKFGARNYNEALMDLGRSICKARSATCEICPLLGDCVAGDSGLALNYPRENEKTKMENSNTGIPLALVRVIVEEDGKLLAYKKSESEWLSGQYEIPTFILDTEDDKLSQYPRVSMKDLKILPSFRTGITKYKIDNFVIHMSFNEFKKNFDSSTRFTWIENRDYISTSSLKALKLL